MSLTSYLSTTEGQQAQQANQQNTAQANLYNPAQQGLQGNLGGLYSNLLGGNIPSSFTNPQAATQALQANLTNYTDPTIAAQFGAGSPQIASQNALAMQQLTGQLYNTGVGNYLNTLGGAQNYAFNPIGGTQGVTGTGAQNLNQQSQATINPLFYLLMSQLGTGIGQGTQNLGNYLFNSDVRLKDRIKDVDTDALQQVGKLRVVNWHWKEELGLEPTKQIGFIAQEVAEIIPEAVSTDFNGIYRIDFAKIVPVLVKAIQQQQKEIEALKARKED